MSVFLKAMGKKTTPPSFLQEELSESVISLVRKNVSPFLDRAKRNHGSTLPSNLELLKEFFAYLSKKSRSFRNIHDDAIKTTFKGIARIYDILRKKVPSHIEEKAHEPEGQKTKGNTSDSKEPTPQKSRGRPKAEQGPTDAVQIIAETQHKGLEEKKTMFRKDLHSDREPSESSLNPPSVTASDQSTAKKSTLGKRQFREMKQQFIDLLDAYEEDDLAGIVFDVHIKAKGAYVTHR